MKLTWEGRRKKSWKREIEEDVLLTTETEVPRGTGDVMMESNSVRSTGLCPSLASLVAWVGMLLYGEIGNRWNGMDPSWPVCRVAPFSGCWLVIVSSLVASCVSLSVALYSSGHSPSWVLGGRLSFRHQSAIRRLSAWSVASLLPAPVCRCLQSIH